MQSTRKIILKQGKDQSLKRFHPWIFSGAIKRIETGIVEGDLISLWSNDGEFLGMGHYQIGSIAVRMVTFQEQEIGYDFWKEKIEKAWLLRRYLGFDSSEHTNVFRLVHAEGDGLPGLVIDFYHGTAVLQIHSVGFFYIRDLLIRALHEVLGNRLKAVYDKSEKSLPYKAAVNPSDGLVSGAVEGNEVLEHGLKFHVDWENGQKTGFFSISARTGCYFNTIVKTGTC